MKPFVLLPVALCAAACANSGANYEPVVDGPKNANYYADLNACQSLAASQPAVDGTTAGAAAVGAVGGAATNAIWNDSSDNIGEAAAIGALAAVTGDAVRKNNQREAVVKNCMRGRGHNVVG